MDYSYDKSDAEAYTSTFRLSLAPGIEKHFGGTHRLSPYIGATLPIGMRSSKQETENYIANGTTSNLRSGDRSNFNIGLTGLAGVDYYFAPRFYTGFEVGLGLRYTNYNDIETTFMNDFSRTPQITEGYHNINFSPSANGGIRLGFVF